MCVDQRCPVDSEVVGVRICRIDGGMVDNIMMASAGQGGAGLRGDQYYPPPPTSSVPFSSPSRDDLRVPLVPTAPLSPRSTTIAVSTLQTSTFSPFHRLLLRLLVLVLLPAAVSLVLGIELLARRDGRHALDHHACVSYQAEWGLFIRPAGCRAIRRSRRTASFIGRPLLMWWGSMASVAAFFKSFVGFESELVFMGM